MNIIVFDSGVGALSIVDAMMEASISGNYNVMADTAFFPYGNKTDKELLQRTEQLLTEKVGELNPDIMIIACNTASTLVLPRLRQLFTFPIVGVVPAIKPAVEQSQTKAIGVLATSATIKRDYTQQLIDDHAKGCKVYLHACDSLVYIAERQLTAGDVDIQEIKQLLDAFVKAHINMDTMVLACTHFPLLKVQLQQLYPQINWVDSGQAIAKRVKFVLNNNRLVNNERENRHLFITTSNMADNNQLKRSLITRGFHLNVDSYT